MQGKEPMNAPSESHVAPKKKSSVKLRFLISYLRPYAFAYFIGWIFLVLSTLAGLVFPYLMGGLLGADAKGSSVDSIGKALSNNSVNGIALALFLLFGVQALFSFFGWCSSTTLRKMRCAIYATKPLNA